MRFRQPLSLFRKPQPADRDLLPWWHPASLLRGAWNLAFSAALGIGIGALTRDLVTQRVATLAGVTGLGSGDWQDWHGPLQPVAWIVGCFVAVVAYMSYRMDDKTDA